MNKKVVICFLLLVGVLATIPRLASARMIYFGGETEVITLVYGGATLFRFPGEVRTISQASRYEIAPDNGDQPNYALL